MAKVDLNNILLVKDDTVRVLKSIDGKDVGSLSYNGKYYEINADGASFVLTVSQDSVMQAYSGQDDQTFFLLVTDSLQTVSDNMDFLLAQATAYITNFENAYVIIAVPVENPNYDSTLTDGSLDSYKTIFDVYIVTSIDPVSIESLGTDVSSANSLVIGILSQLFGDISSATPAEVSAMFGNLTEEQLATIHAQNAGVNYLFDTITTLSGIGMLFVKSPTYVQMKAVLDTDALTEAGSFGETKALTVEMTTNAGNYMHDSASNFNFCYYLVSTADGKYIETNQPRTDVGSEIKLITNSTLKTKISWEKKSTSGGDSGDGNVCLTGDTLITMADRSKKRLDQIKPGEKVLSLNKNGDFVEDEVIYSDWDQHKTNNCFVRYILSDGGHIDVVIDHRFYDLETKKYVHMSKWKAGHHLEAYSGTPVEIIRKVVVPGDVGHYTIITKKHCNYFANGYLSGHRRISRLAAKIKNWVWRKKTCRK